MARRPARTPTFEEDLLAVKKLMDRARLDRQRLANAPARQRRILLGLAAAVLLALSALVCSAAVAMDGEKLVTIAALLQPVWVTRWEKQSARAAARPEDAHLSEVVQSGDLIGTGDGGGAHLEFPDETLVKIGPDSSFRVLYNSFSRRTGGRRRRFYLWYGRIWCRVSKFVSADSEFTVETPAAVAGVRGTRFSVMVYRNSGLPGVPDGTTVVSVQDGQVSVVARGVSRRTLLKAGQETAVFPGMDTPAAPRWMDRPERDAWAAQRKDGLGDALADPPSRLTLAYINFAEQFAGRALAILASLVHLDRLSGESEDKATDATAGQTVLHRSPDGLNLLSEVAGARGSLARARIAAVALQLAMQNSEDPATGYPETIGLKDLSNVRLRRDKVEGILSNVDGHQIQRYQRTKSGYIMELRSLPPGSTLLRVTPDSIDVVDDVTIK